MNVQFNIYFKHFRFKELLKQLSSQLLKPNWKIKKMDLPHQLEIWSIIIIRTWFRFASAIQFKSECDDELFRFTHMRSPPEEPHQAPAIQESCQLGQSWGQQSMCIIVTTVRITKRDILLISIPQSQAKKFWQN